METPVRTWPSLALAFVLELCALAAFAVWGAHVGGRGWTAVLLAVLGPALAAVVWGLFASPRAPITAPGSAAAVQIAFFVLAAAALGAADHSLLALGLLGAVTANAAVLRLLRTSPAAVHTAP